MWNILGEKEYFFLNILFLVYILYFFIDIIIDLGYILLSKTDSYSRGLRVFLLSVVYFREQLEKY